MGGQEERRSAAAGDDRGAAPRGPRDGERAPRARDAGGRRGDARAARARADRLDEARRAVAADAAGAPRGSPGQGREPHLSAPRNRDGRAADQDLFPSPGSQHRDRNDTHDHTVNDRDQRPRGDTGAVGTLGGRRPRADRGQGDDRLRRFREARPPDRDRGVGREGEEEGQAPRPSRRHGRRRAAADRGRAGDGVHARADPRQAGGRALQPRAASPTPTTPPRGDRSSSSRISSATR